MFGAPRYIRVFLYLCTCWSIFCIIFFIFPNFLGGRVSKKLVSKQIEHRKEIVNVMRIPPRGFNLNDEQIGKMSSLGRWLLSSEGSFPPPRINTKKEPYLILIWMHGKFLERRHIKRFTDKEYSPWENCSVSECVISYQSKDMAIADAVIFHLHLTKSVSELPHRTRREQRWIFLTDESPMHTFLYGNQQISKYNGLFNWSMTYRMDSDIPVPYGRVIPRSHINFENDSLKDFVMKRKQKLVAVMGSNCGGTNNRWGYVRELKTILGNDLDIYGKCLNGNMTACPGHFHSDCQSLNAYKFYLAFENSNCKEYLTEKVFWNAYEKLAVPIIMGAPKRDCERLLPPESYLHVSDFANPSALANYVRYLNRHDDKYLEFHKWRKYYKVINEHGYFKSISRHYCRVCEALHYNSPNIKVYENLQSFWNKNEDCIS